MVGGAVKEFFKLIGGATKFEKLRKAIEDELLGIERVAISLENLIQYLRKEEEPAENYVKRLINDSYSELKKATDVRKRIKNMKAELENYRKNITEFEEASKIDAYLDSLEVFEKQLLDTLFGINKILKDIESESVKITNKSYFIVRLNDSVKALRKLIQELKQFK